MKITLPLIAVLFTCFIFASCKKEPADPTPPQPPLRDSVTLLSRIAYVDVSSSPTDTMGYRDFVYDSLRRVTSINLSPVDLSPYEIFTYYYMGNDTLAWKKTDIDNDLVIGYTETYFYYYDNQQRLIKDSVVYDSIVEVHNYTYSNSMITMKGRIFDPYDPSYIFNERDTGFKGNSGDIIQTNSYYDSDSTKHFLAYDTHPNPFFPLNIRSTYNPIPGYNFFLEDLYFQKNNVTTIHAPFNSSLEIYTYTYNAEGYPSSVSIHFEDVPQDDYKMVFFYKKF